MKTLYIVRHAKSSWEDIELPDFDRPLNARGKKDVPRMAKRLKEREVHPQVMLTSPAKRALLTCESFADILGYPRKNIQTERKLYHANEDTILKVIQDIKATCDLVLIFGHNPGLTDFVNAFGSNTDIDNLPTTGIVAFEIPVEKWNEVTWGMGKQILFDFPKSRKD